MLLSGLESAKFDLMVLKTKEKTEKEKDSDYESCIKSRPCPNENTNLEKLTKEEKQKTIHCRLKRFLECSTPEKEEL